MTPHQQNIEIAKLLPELVAIINGNVVWKDTELCVTDREWLYVIHEAVDSLTPDQKNRFHSALHRVVAISNSQEEVISRHVAEATYPQRREALLRTLNLWED